MKSRFTNKKNSLKSAKRYSRIITKPSKTRSVKRQSMMTKIRNSYVANIELTFSIWGHGGMVDQKITTPKETYSSNIEVWLMGLKNAGVCSLRADYLQKSQIVETLSNKKFDMKQHASSLKFELEKNYKNIYDNYTITHPYTHANTPQIIMQVPDNDVWYYSKVDQLRTGNKILQGEPHWVPGDDATYKYREVEVKPNGPTLFLHKMVLLDANSNIIQSIHLNDKIFMEQNMTLFGIFTYLYNNIHTIVREKSKKYKNHVKLIFENPVKLSLYVYDDTCNYNEGDINVPFRDTNNKNTRFSVVKK